VSHVLLLNQDAWIESDVIEKLLKKDDGRSLLSPIHLNGTGSKIDYNFKHYSLKETLFDSAAFDGLFLKHGVDIIHADFVNAACWLLPVRIIKTVGGFNPMFYH